VPKRPELAVVLFLGALSACGGAPAPALERSAEQTSTPPPLRRRADLVDDCAELPGQPPPEPLRTEYTGVARAARCQREVYTIMGGLTHFLGVKCEYCHVEDDYPAPTHNKRVANWMATELIPSLEKKDGGALWCNDCHTANGKPTAKILGVPRRQGFVIEWMTTHLTERFERASDQGNLLCKDCHRGNLGSPGFQRRIILSDHLPDRGRPLDPPPAERAAEPDAAGSLPRPDARPSP
jgi:hypothetical protein